MKFPAWYALVVGFGMLAQWTVSIVSGGVPEFESEPWRIAFHLAAELSTALTLIIGGLAALRSIPGSRNVLLLGLGMVIYSEIVSPGYFAQLGEWPMVGMFAVVLGAGLASLIVLFRQAAAAERD